MAVTHGTPTRNALCSAIATAVGAGGKLKVRDGSNVVLATYAMNSTPFGAPSGGSMAINGAPLTDASSDASGTAANFVVTDASDVTIFAGSVTVTGGGGDLQLASLAFTSGAAAPNITSGTYTAPA